MALLVCTECSGKVSDKAEFCPHCGCLIKEILSKQQIATSASSTRIEAVVAM